MTKNKAKRTRISDNFFAHVDQSGGPDSCWPFQRSKNKKGYGKVWVNGRCEEAHRYAYLVAHGPVPQGFCVLHRCDNPPCCNPGHLWLGTRVQNNQDRDEKGRGKNVRGEENGFSKLTTRQVLFIRRCRDLFNSQEMAEMLGVQRAEICKVLSGEVWAHVQEIGMPSYANPPFACPPDEVIVAEPN